MSVRPIPLADMDTARLSRDFLQSIAESCADTIITADVAGRVTWVSPSVEKTFGFQPDELVGWPVAELFAGGRDEARAIVRHLGRADSLRNYVTTFPGPAGRRLSVSASIAVLRDATGTAIGMIAILTDISASLHFDVVSDTISLHTG